MKKPPFHYVEGGSVRARCPNKLITPVWGQSLLMGGDLKNDRMHTSTLVTPGRHRHRPVAKTEVEQPPAILLPALRSLCFARWKIARHTISVVSCLDSCQSGPPKSKRGRQWRPRLRPLPSHSLAQLCWNVNAKTIERTFDLGKKLAKNS